MLPESRPGEQKDFSLLPESHAKEIVSLYRQGKLDEAIALAEKEAAAFKKYSSNSAAYANALFNLAILYRAKADALGKIMTGMDPKALSDTAQKSFDFRKEVEGILRESVRVYDQSDVKENAAAIEAKSQLAWQLGQGQPIPAFSDLNRERVDEAEKIYLDVLAVQEKKFGKTDEAALKTVLSLADLYVKRMKFEEGLPLYDRYIAALERSPINRNKDMIPVLRTLAQIFEITGRHNEALELAKRIGAMTGAPEEVLPPTPNLAYRATYFEKIAEFPLSNLKNFSTDKKTFKLKMVTVRILIDENGNVVEAKADPGNGQIKDLKKYEEAAMRSKFRPFIYQGMKYKMRGIVTYQQWERGD